MVESMLPPGSFTVEQIRGTLENYKNDKEQAVKQLKFKLQEREKGGKKNVKAQIKTQVESEKI